MCLKQKYKLVQINCLFIFNVCAFHCSFVFDLRFSHITLEKVSMQVNFECILLKINLNIS